MWLKALHGLENLCSPWSVLYKKIKRNELKAKLIIKQEQAAVLQVVNYDQTQLCTFLTVSAGVNNACQNNHEVDVSLTIELAAYNFILILSF